MASELTNLGIVLGIRALRDVWIPGLGDAVLISAATTTGMLAILRPSPLTLTGVVTTLALSFAIASHPNSQAVILIATLIVVWLATVARGIGYSLTADSSAAPPGSAVPCAPVPAEDFKRFQFGLRFILMQMALIATLIALVRWLDRGPPDGIAAGVLGSLAGVCGALCWAVFLVTDHDVRGMAAAIVALVSMGAGMWLLCSAAMPIWQQLSFMSFVAGEFVGLAIAGCLLRRLGLRISRLSFPRPAVKTSAS